MGDKYGCSNKPLKCQVVDPHTEDAWYYENKGGIEIHAVINNAQAVLRIPRRKLASWIARTEPQS